MHDTPFPESPVLPEMLDGSNTIRFRCHRDVACWNACCSNIDISLTPYDILRLKRRLDLTSTEFLERYTVPYEMEKEGIAGVKLRPVEGGTACRFMAPEGCSVYADRPTACRYYPVALLSMRKQGEATDRDAYAMVKEPHCLGHQEPRDLTIDAYRAEQGLPEYDELARGWRQLILKKKSSGPTVGKPSKRSLQLFFLACYDVDRFRAFVGERRIRGDLRSAGRRARHHPGGRRRRDAVRLPLPAPGAVRRSDDPDARRQRRTAARARRGAAGATRARGRGANRTRRGRRRRRRVRGRGDAYCTGCEGRSAAGR